MNAFVALILSGLIVVLGLLLYPNFHQIIGSFDISRMYPLAKALIIGMPYIFLVIVGFILMKLWKKS